jgi:hypothetical protein
MFASNGKNDEFFSLHSPDEIGLFMLLQQHGKSSCYLQFNVEKNSTINLSSTDFELTFDFFSYQGLQ